MLYIPPSFLQDDVDKLLVSCQRKQEFSQTFEKCTTKWVWVCSSQVGPQGLLFQWAETSLTCCGNCTFIKDRFHRAMDFEYGEKERDSKSKLNIKEHLHRCLNANFVQPRALIQFMGDHPQTPCSNLKATPIGLALFASVESTYYQSHLNEWTARYRRLWRSEGFFSLSTHKS